MLYNEKIAKELCREMGIEWDCSAKVATLNQQPLNQDFSIVELFSAEESLRNESQLVINIKINAESKNFNCSDASIMAA